MRKSIRYSSPSEVWKKFHRLIQENEETFNKTVAEINELSSYLESYKDSSDISQLARIAIEINVNASMVNAVSNPRGSMIDYKNDVSSLIIRNQELLSRFKSSSPNPEMVNTPELNRKVDLTLESCQLSTYHSFSLGSKVTKGGE